MEPTPQSLQDLDLATLVGRPVEDARAIVEAAGGALRTAEPGQPVTLDYRANRVTLLVTDGRVVETAGIG